MCLLIIKSKFKDLIKGLAMFKAKNEAVVVCILPRAAMSSCAGVGLASTKVFTVPSEITLRSLAEPTEGEDVIYARLSTAFIYNLI